MRKIKTQADIEKKKHRDQIIVGSVMIFLLFGSILGYSLASRSKDDSDSKVSENGYDFYIKNSLWMTEINGDVFSFQNLPSEVLDIEVNVSIKLEQYFGQPLYFVNPNEGISDILNNIGKYALRYQEACLENETCVGDLPIKSCDSKVIIFVPQSGLPQNNNDSRVYQNGSCVFIVGDSLKATDAFLYKLLQVIE